MVHPSPEEEQLIKVSEKFLAEVCDLTPGKALEAKLNREYGQSSSSVY